MTDYKYLQWEHSERIGIVTLNRPEKRNALNDELVSELIEALKQARDNEAIKVIILKANGSVFSAGADLDYLKQLQANSFEDNLADSTALKDLFKLIYTLPKLVISQIQGHAIAGGCGLASICDFSFASQEASFGYTEVKIGFVPAIVLFFLLRKVGETAIRKLLLSGELISADEAKSIGLISEVVATIKLEEHVRNFASKLVLNTSPQSVSLTKKMLVEIQSKSFDDALDYAAQQNAKARSNEDCLRGITAFINKEKINW